MTTVAGTVLDATGAAASGCIVRAYRRDTGALLGEAVSSDGTPIPGDDNFASVSLLLHMEGLADSSGTPKSASLTGGAIISGLASKFGSKSLSPSSGGLLVPSHPDFELGDDFTFEASVLINSWTPGLASLFNIGAYNAGVLFRLQSNKIETWINGAPVEMPIAIPTGTWHHFAWSRHAGTVRVFMGGDQVSSFPNSAPIPQANVLIGASSHASSEYINGFVDEVRLTKGVARYTASFTPPTRELPNSALGTMLPVGHYLIDCGTYTGEVQVVCLDDDAGTLQNDQILRTFGV